MENWMIKLSDEEKQSLEAIPNHEGFYTYSDKFGTHYLMKGNQILHEGKEIEVFSSGDYAITKDYDTWTLYRGEDILCEGVWVLSHANKSYTFKYYNETIGRYIIETIGSDGEKQDEVEVNSDDVGHTRTDYMNFV